MKILVVDGSNYIDFPPGGVKFYTHNFVKTLDEQHSAALVGLTINKKEKVGKWSFREIGGRRIPFLPAYFVDGNRDPHRKPLVPIRIGMTVGLLRNMNAIKISHFDIVYVHFPELVIPFIFPLKRSKVAFHLHGTIREAATNSRYGFIKNPFITGLFYLINKWALAKSDVVFAISHEGLNLVTSIFPDHKNRSLWIPVMVDTGIFYPSNDKIALRKKYRFNSNEKIMIFTGRLERSKQVDLLIEYVHLLSEEISDLRLVIAGSGSDYERLVKMSEDRHIPDKVRFLGEVDHNKILPEILNCADIYVFVPSVGEGFPASVLEAIACGLPVLSHDVGDVRNVVTDSKTGFLLKDRNYIDFKEKSLRVFSNLADFSTQAVNVAQQYSIYRVTKSIVTSFENIVQQ